MKNLILLASVVGSLCAGAVPTISNVSVTCNSAKVITVKYQLTGGPAVVTLDVLTNSAAWTSIGIDALVGTNSAYFGGDVFRRVSGDGEHTIIWNAYRGWGADGGNFAPGEMKFDVKAYPIYDAPDYLVADLREGVAAADRVKYYPSEDFLPGGLLANPAYRTTHLVLRRIHARNVRYTMGVTATGNNFYEPVATGGKDAETVHRVTLDHDYYIGVFEITQGQWQLVCGNNPSFYKNAPESPMRPAEQVSYARLREAAYNCNESTGDAAHPGYQWPNPPHGDSFLGKLRTLTGNEIDFDLPGDVEWEFACRAGLPEGYWNDGTDAKDLAHMPGRNNQNGGWLPGGSSYPNDASLGPTNATAVCGSYNPNRWGLYDMHGNVQEWCLDWYQQDYRRPEVNIDPNNPSKTLSGVAGSSRCRRGGSFNVKPFEPSAAVDCRASSRSSITAGKAYVNLGGRVACRAGLK